MPKDYVVVGMPRALELLDLYLRQEQEDALRDAGRIAVDVTQATIVRMDLMASGEFFRAVQLTNILRVANYSTLAMVVRDNPKKIGAITEGLEPGEAVPPLDVIVAWMLDRGITPNEGTVIEAANAIRWHIWHYGFEGRDVFGESKRLYTFRVRRRLRSGVTRAIRRLPGNRTNRTQTIGQS